MHLSRYLKVFPCVDPSDQVFIYSTRQTSIIMIPKDMLKDIEDGNISDEERETLLEVGVLVEDPVAEQEEVTTLFDRINAENTNMRVVVILNMDCNFACPYCYEGNRKGNLYMSEETAKQVIAFIGDRFVDGKDLLTVDFHGGEPLLSPGRISSMATELKALIEERGGKFEFNLVTNGSLLSRSKVKEMVSLGLKSVKVTIDGPAEVHDEHRPFKSGKGSFDILIQNVKDTCDLVKMTIGGNYYRHNYERFVELLDHLESQGLTPDKLAMVKFDPVMDMRDSQQRTAEWQTGCLSANDPWIIEAEELLREEILKRGYYTPKPGPIFCMVENHNTFIADWDGKLYKCPGFVGMDEYAVGNVYDRIPEDISSYKPGIWKTEECLECEYLPLCYGGCRFMSLVRENGIEAPDCRREYFDHALENLIKQDIRYPREDPDEEEDA